MCAATPSRVDIVDPAAIRRLSLLFLYLYRWPKQTTTKMPLSCGAGPVARASHFQLETKNHGPEHIFPRKIAPSTHFSADKQRPGQIVLRKIDPRTIFSAEKLFPEHIFQRKIVSRTIFSAEEQRPNLFFSGKSIPEQSFPRKNCYKNTFVR